MIRHVSFIYHTFQLNDPLSLLKVQRLFFASVNMWTFVIVVIIIIINEN